MNYFITKVNRSLFNFISKMISGGGFFFESVVWFALKVALFKLCLYI